MAKSHIGGSLTAAGTAAAAAEKKKRAKYMHILDRVAFQPLAFETFGPWGPDTKAWISKVARMVEEQTGEKRSHEYIRQTHKHEDLAG